MNITFVVDESEAVEVVTATIGEPLDGCLDFVGSATTVNRGIASLDQVYLAQSSQYCPRLDQHILLKIKCHFFRMVL